jgi:geranylgeranyl pyrophosphate synthase
MIGDMRRGKVTLAMIDMYNKDKKYRGTLDRYAERKVTPDELPAFFKVMDKCGSINYVKDTAETYVNSAVSAISSFPDNKYTRALRKLPDYMRDALMAEVQ